ncbi:serine hydrolase domain-containing protein [Flagellimonas pacifica]|uniref:CubicO group peptidase, beta-lactamase class C family n=1 Tax=Flagellimonas pacifica TaxID=1247520 RepID=A0A285N0L1_9FLAO|nr:serine hydrolase [Allomuricauda parva]SNZ01291.1 CubicO group peptidase, beta-lactamase class C family [Allomuricauda parva]
MKFTLVTIVFFLCVLPANAQLNFSKTNKSNIPLLNKMDSVVSSGKYERITSILIAKDGNVLFEKYYNENDVNSKHNTRSVTKTMATLLTGIAIDKGYITSENDKIFDYLQHKLPVKNPDKRKEEITIEDLLTMSSIVECNDSNRFSRGNEERMYIIEDWAKFYLDLPVYSYPWGPKPKDRPYGRAFSYCSAGAALVAEILQSAIKSNLVEFAKKNLFEPLAIKDYNLHYTPSNLLNTAGGSEYRSRDLLKLIQLCLNKGQWNGKQIISSSWIEKATTTKLEAYDAEYGYLFWLKNFGKDKKYKSFFMSGTGGNKVLANPELGLSVVITTTNYRNRNAHNITDEIMNDFIIPAMLDKTSR